MPPSTQKPSGQDETWSRISETVLDGAMDKIADLVNSHRALQPLWKAVVIGADVVEAFHYHITTPLTMDVARSTARVLCFESILPMISVSRFFLGSFEDGCSAQLYFHQCAVIYLVYGAHAAFLYAKASAKNMQAADLVLEATGLALALSVTFALHSTVSLVDAVLALGTFFLPGWLFSLVKILALLLWKTDNTQAGRESATSETRPSVPTDHPNKSCSSVEDALRPKAELEGSGISNDSNDTATATPTSNIITVLQENLMIAQNNIKLVELARQKDWNIYNADMISCRDQLASMTVAHQAETANLTDRLYKMNTACAQMQTTSHQQELSELKTKLSEAEKQLEAKRNALENMRLFWEADVISKRNALQEKTIRLEHANSELNSTTKKFKDLAESTNSKEATFAAKESEHRQFLARLQQTCKSLQSELKTSQDKLHTSQTQLIEARKEYLILSAQHETSSKEIQNLTQQTEALAKMSEKCEKRIRSLKSWCKYWQATAISEHDARVDLHEQVGLARDGIEKIGEKEVEDARRGCGEKAGEDGMEVDKSEKADGDWEKGYDDDDDDDDEYSVAAKEEE